MHAQTHPQETQQHKYTRINIYTHDAHTNIAFEHVDPVQLEIAHLQNMLAVLLQIDIIIQSFSFHMQLCCRLGAVRILLIESGDQDIHQRIRLNHPVSDVSFALAEE